MKIKDIKLVVIILATLVSASLLISFWLTHIQEQEFTLFRRLHFKRRFHDSLTNSMSNRDSTFHIRQHGSYWILYNYIVATHAYVGNESVTLALHGEFTDLKGLSSLVRRWRAPISLTLFTNGMDFENAKEIILFLIRCSVYGEDIRNFVTFNFLMHEDHLPRVIPRSEREFFSRQANCMRTPFKTVNQTQAQTHRQSYNLTYPINMARNIARQTVSTYYVLSIDTNYLPSIKFPQEFLKMVYKLVVKNPLKTVYVLPILEATRGGVLPESKKEFSLYNKTLFMPEILQHRIPKLMEWYDRKEFQSITVFDIVKHVGIWQPWYVSANEYEPLADERFTQDCHVQRTHKIDLLELLGYDFVILDNAFLVHYMLPDVPLNEDGFRRKKKNSSPHLQYHQKLLILKNFLMNFM